jgi:Trk K+ transport system NAD-binding subunit
VFAAAILDHQVLRTIAVGRHVLVIADVPVGAGSALAGWAVRDVHERGTVRVIALRPRGTDRVDWSPRQDYQLQAQDRIYVLATRAGLSGTLRRAEKADDKPAGGLTGKPAENPAGAPE